jgi:two-component system, NtrC family, sensor kinase
MPTQLLDMERSSPQSQQTDTSLRHSEARFQRIAASVPGVIYQFLKHPDGSLAFPFVSPSCREILEVEAIEIEADANVLLSMLHPEDLADFNQSVALSSETLQVWQWEGQLTLPSGRLIWLQGAAVPERDENGDMLWNGLLMDITTRKQAEKERVTCSQATSESDSVREAFSVSGTGRASVQGVGIRTQRFLNSLLENLPVAVFVKESEALRYVFWNKTSTQLIGYCAQDVLGKSGYDLFPTEEVDSFIVQDRDVLESGQLLDVPEECLQTPHRGQRIFRTKKIPILDEAGRPQYLLGITEDITERKQTEAALRQSQEHLQTVMTSAPIILYAIDRQGIFTLSEGKGLEALELQSGQLVGSSIYDVYSDKPEVIEYFNRALQGEQLENIIVNYAGILFDIRYSILRDEHGNIVGVTGIALDITERYKVKEALQQSEQKFRRLVENANDIIYQLTSDGVFSYVSPNWVDILGHEVQDVEGKVFTLFVHPDDLPICLGTLRRALENGEKQSGIEYRVKHKNGTWRWHTSNLSVLRDANGSIVSVVGIARDISDAYRQATQRKQAEEALRESEERFRNLVESTHDLIWEIDENAIYTYVSPQIKDILGYDVEEVLGKTPFDFMPPEEADYITEIMSNRVALRLPITNLENTNIHQDGYIVILETSGVPFFDKAGNFKGYRGIDRDITKRKQTEEAIRQSKAQLEQTLRQLQNTQAQLIQTEKMSSLGQLVAGVAHEINNPINFIYGNIKHAKNYITDLLRLITLYQDIYPQPAFEIEAEIETIDLHFLIEDFPKLLDSMEVGAERIRGIVRSLRTFSRLDESAAKAVDLRQGIDSTLILLQSRLQPPLSSQTIQVVKEYSNLPLVKCYPGELNQVFMNLLSNAIDALEKRNRSKNFEVVQANPSTIRIRTEINSQPNSIPWVVIRIADNGIGMSEEILSRAFDPFFTTKPVGEGTGLGLAISYQIVVELHKGRLYCSSSPGEGAEFVIEIPIQ